MQNPNVCYVILSEAKDLLSALRCTLPILDAANNRFFASLRMTCQTNEKKFKH